jgi:hypothetical protein
VAVALLVALGAVGAALQPWFFVAAAVVVLLALVVFEMWAYQQARAAAAPA